MSLKKLEPRVNPEECNRNQLNNSTSKMQYTFSKSRRFNQSLSNTIPYYEIPNKLDKRSTCFGFGNKTTFEDRRVLPPPNAYKPPSEFDDRKHGVSFGYSRDKVRNASMFLRSEVPGPGSYNPKDVRHDVSFALKSRVRDNTLDQKIKVPGPGTYVQLELINKIGRYPSSKYENSKCPIISKSNYRAKTEQTPAPNSYFPIMLNSRGQKSMLQTKATKFGHSRRRGIFEASDNPGPGKYEQFSEFLK